MPICTCTLLHTSQLMLSSYSPCPSQTFVVLHCAPPPCTSLATRPILVVPCALAAALHGFKARKVTPNFEVRKPTARFHKICLKVGCYFVSQGIHPRFEQHLRSAFGEGEGRNIPRNQAEMPRVGDSWALVSVEQVAAESEKHNCCIPNNDNFAFSLVPFSLGLRHFCA